MSQLMLPVLGSIAQFERNPIKERQREGIALASRRGAYRGRKKAVTDEMLPASCGLTAPSPRGATTHLELLLLPFNARPHTPISLTGMLAPFENPDGLLGDLALTSWRYIHPPPQKIIPRALRKLAIARGLMVYEGLR